MKLIKLLEDVEVLNDINDICLSDIKQISNKLDDEKEDCLYFCYQGESIDGHKKDLKHLEGYAKAIVVEHYIDSDIPQILVKDSRKAMALIARNFYNTKDVKIIGITGTNGKTTTSFLIGHILTQAGNSVGVIGTEGIYFKGQVLPAKLTTPDPIDLHEIISIMKKAGVMYVVMEVSAHAIYLKKVEGINFVAKILTNITRDHLDFFGNMDDYARTKLSFMNKAPIRIYPSDDEYTKKFLREGEKILTFGIENPSDAFAVEMNNECSSYIINICDYIADIKCNLYGLFNVYNVLCASLCCLAMGVNINTIKNAIESFNAVAGRFNVIKISNNRKIIIDFAHTPDGLENVIKTARNITEGNLFCLFGCGGNRDKTKRSVMGKIADKLADFIYITSDNPRFEEPEDIINDILNGVTSKNYYKNVDRARTIKVAMENLKDNDSLIICGKGAENYIQIKDKKIPYSDFMEVRNNIKEMI